MVEVRMTLRDEIIVLHDVPQGACPNCGSRVYKAEVLERIEAVMRNESVDRRLNRHTV
jgi:YgiT-type zinc finger domain-containing protein